MSGKIFKHDDDFYMNWYGADPIQYAVGVLIGEAAAGAFASSVAHEVKTNRYVAVFDSVGLEETINTNVFEDVFHQVLNAGGDHVTARQ